MIFLFLFLLLSTFGRAEFSSEANCVTNRCFVLFSCKNGDTVLGSIDEKNPNCNEQTLEMVVEIDTISARRFDFRVFYRHNYTELNLPSVVFITTEGATLTIKDKGTHQYDRDENLNITDRTPANQTAGILRSFRFSIALKPGDVNLFDEFGGYYGKRFVQAKLPNRDRGHHDRFSYYKTFMDHVRCDPSEIVDYCTVEWQTCDNITAGSQQCSKQLWQRQSHDTMWYSVKGYECNKGVWRMNGQWSSWNVDSHSVKMICAETVRCNVSDIVDHCSEEWQECEKINITTSGVSGLDRDLWHKTADDKWVRGNGIECADGVWKMKANDSEWIVQPSAQLISSRGIRCNPSDLVDYCDGKDCQQLKITAQSVETCSTRLWLHNSSDDTWLWVNEIKCDDGKWMIGRDDSKWNVSSVKLTCAQSRPLCAMESSDKVLSIILGVYCVLASIVLIALFVVMYRKMDDMKGPSKYKVVRVQGTRDRNTPTSGSSSGSSSGSGKKKRAKKPIKQKNQLGNAIFDPSTSHTSSKKTKKGSKKSLKENKEQKEESQKDSGRSGPSATEIDRLKTE